MVSSIFSCEFCQKLRGLRWTLPLLLFTLVNEFEDKMLCINQKGQSETVLRIEFDFLRWFGSSKSFIYCGNLLKGFYCVGPFYKLRKLLLNTSVCYHFFPIYLFFLLYTILSFVSWDATDITFTYMRRWICECFECLFGVMCMNLEEHRCLIILSAQEGRDPWWFTVEMKVKDRNDLVLILKSP